MKIIKTQYGYSFNTLEEGNFKPLKRLNIRYLRQEIVHSRKVVDTYMGYFAGTTVVTQKEIINTVSEKRLSIKEYLKLVSHYKNINNIS